MITHRLPILAGSMLCLTALAGVANAQMSSGDEALFYTRPGEFFVGNGETKSIVHAKTDKEYRVCVERSSAAVPLKVYHDGDTAVVHPGDCADFEAMNLRVTPDGNLPDDYLIVGKFHELP